MFEVFDAFHSCFHFFDKGTLVEALVFLDISNKQECFLEQKMEVEIVAMVARIVWDVQKNK